MAQNRKQYSAACKLQTALEAAKAVKTINQVASDLGVPPNQSSQWNQQVLSEGNTVFGDKRKRRSHEQASRETVMAHRQV